MFIAGFRLACRQTGLMVFFLSPRSLSDLFHECDGDDFFVVTDAVKRRLAGPNKQAATPQSVKITPSLRVVRKNNEYCK